MLDPNTSPPQLAPLSNTLAKIPPELLSWIAEKHVQYLDDRIHKIDPLTQYLEHCNNVEVERNEFIQFVDTWARKENPNLTQYLTEYTSRFKQARERVDTLCDHVLETPQILDNPETILKFWRQFTYVNEIDSLHGMFLTSGRWYVNIMLPTVKELIFCTLSSDMAPTARNAISYHVARRLITPRFANVPADYNPIIERNFAKLFRPLLAHFDRKLLILFEAFASLGVNSFQTLESFVHAVSLSPEPYTSLLGQGIYPPFGWHELVASRCPRRTASTYTEAVKPFLAAVQEGYHARAHAALECLAVQKEYEMNYNTYNYKGRFGLISKYQYWRTAQQLAEPARTYFLDAILLDKFYVALEVLEQAFGDSVGDFL